MMKETGKTEASAELGGRVDSVVMPRELTAENGAKGLLIGEFFEAINIDCSECFGDGDIDGEPCDACDTVGSHLVKVPINWTTIKDIYAMAVKHLAA